MKSWSRLLILATLAFLADAASAEGSQESAAGLHWRCWYDQKTNIVCLIDALPESGNPALAGLPANLPPLVATMRRNPEWLRGTIIGIPLHTPPYDMELTAQLARATACGSRRDCAVAFTDRPPPAYELVELLSRYWPDRDDGDLLAMLDAPSDDSTDME